MKEKKSIDLFERLVYIFLKLKISKPAWNYIQELCANASYKRENLGIYYGGLQIFTVMGNFVEKENLLKPILFEERMF